MYPLLPSNIDITKIKISDINYIGNTPICNFLYNQNEILYIESPLLSFNKIVIDKNDNNRILYLSFDNDKDLNTYSFISLINSIQNLSIGTINKMTNNILSIRSIINIIKKDENIYMYMKTILTNQIKIEYNNKLININELNNLVNKVDIKIIFQLDRLEMSDSKVGVYLKPVRLRLKDIIIEPEISFRDEDSIIHNNLLYTEVDNIDNILNNNIKPLNNTAFNSINENTDFFVKQFTKNQNEDTFIKQPEQNIDFQKKLQDELFIINNSSEKQNKSNSISSSSSVKIGQMSRTRKPKKTVSDKKSKSDKKQIELLNSEMTSENDT